MFRVEKVNNWQPGVDQKTNILPNTMIFRPDINLNWNKYQGEKSIYSAKDVNTERKFKIKAKTNFARKRPIFGCTLI